MRKIRGGKEKEERRGKRREKRVKVGRKGRGEDARSGLEWEVKRDIGEKRGLRGGGR